MINGPPLKYGDTTVLRFEIPPQWDVLSITGISVSVTNSSGTVLDSGDATLYEATTLDGATSSQATSITLADLSGDLSPGDRIRIGSSSEPGEVREVYSYGSLVAKIVTELEYPHSDGADVCGMFATYSLDMSDTDTFGLGDDLFVRWTPDTPDLDEVENYVIGSTAVLGGDMWEEYSNTFPNDAQRMHGRDPMRFEKFVRRMMRLEFQDKGFDFDRLATTDHLQNGLVLLTRRFVLEGSGDTDQVEYERAVKSFDSWISKVIRLPLWEDSDQDESVDEDSGEIKSYVFNERARYF